MMLRPEGDNDVLSRAYNRVALAHDAQIAAQSRLTAARYAQETFESALDFLVAHELAHRFLGHAKNRGETPPVFSVEACSAWRTEEAVADEFAAVLLVRRQIFAPGVVPHVDGGRLFLLTAFRLTGFSDLLVAGPCTYPKAEERLASIREVLDIGYESNMRAIYSGQGGWVRLPEAARLSTMKQFASKGAETSRVERAVLLIDPLLLEEYKDRKS